MKWHTNHNTVAAMANLDPVDNPHDTDSTKSISVEVVVPVEGSVK
jgi:sulfur carrier protein ThiS